MGPLKNKFTHIILPKHLISFLLQPHLPSPPLGAACASFPCSQRREGGAPASSGAAAPPFHAPSAATACLRNGSPCARRCLCPAAPPTASPAPSTSFDRLHPDPNICMRLRLAKPLATPPPLKSNKSIFYSTVTFSTGVGSKFFGFGTGLIVFNRGAKCQITIWHYLAHCGRPK